MKRRLFERVYPKDERIVLGGDNGEPLVNARVHDVSDSGVLIRIDGQSAVSHGASIRTQARGTSMPRRARVVRIEQTSIGASLETRLACRWVTGAERRRLHHSTRFNTRF